MATKTVKEFSEARHTMPMQPQSMLSVFCRGVVIS
jgi:hypothetical protein